MSIVTGCCLTRDKKLPKQLVGCCAEGEYASLALDPSGHPNIAYYDSPNHALKYAEWKV